VRSTWIDGEAASEMMIAGVSHQQIDVYVITPHVPGLDSGELLLEKLSVVR
jgi:hypothetical protein